MTLSRIPAPYFESAGIFIGLLFATIVLQIYAEIHQK